MFDHASAAIPSGLDDMEPGPVLAGFLSSLDVAELSGHDRIVVLRAHQRLASHYSAQVYADMASVADCMGDSDDDAHWAWEAAATEIRAALRLTRRAADAELGFAIDLQRRLPGVGKALIVGNIDLRRAKTIAHNTRHLPEDTAREVVDRVIEDAPRLTTGQLAARIRKLCIEADPGEAERRYEDAVLDRRVVMEPTESGTANLYGLDLPPHRIAQVTRRINQLARSLKNRDETRTMDQLRADVYLDLLVGSADTGKASRTGGVDIRVDLETLTRLAENPGELAGYGPVIADIARRVTEEQPHAQWRYTVTIPGAVGPCTPAPPDADRTPASAAPSRAATSPASSPDVACPPPAVTSTTASCGRKAVPPRSISSPRCAATTTWSGTEPAGPTDHSPTATTDGPALWVTATPPAGHLHSRGRLPAR